MKYLFTILIAIAAGGCAKFESAVPSGRLNIGPFSLNATPIATCDREAVISFNICVEMIGSEYDEPGYLAILQSSCQSTGGTFSTNNCNRTNAFGTCVVNPGANNEAHTTYYPPLYTESTAQNACATTPGGYYVPN